MSKIEVNAIEPQCGTTLTVGASGDTITFPSGTTIVNNGTQTGFGRTGTVDWDTTPKTATFSAVSGNGYFCNTSGGAFTVNLPAGVAGAIVSLADYAATWQTSNVTVTPNGTDKIGSQNQNAVLSTQGQSVTFVFVDSTQGWINTMDSTSNVRGISPFINATGGTPSQDGDYEIRTFTGPGTFEVTSLSPTPANNVVDYLVVAGGGGGAGNDGGGGGGAGGYRESPGTATGSYTVSPLGVAPAAGITVSVQGYAIVVGAGGTSSASYLTGPGGNGGNSTFSTITSTGGGGGAQYNMSIPCGGGPRTGGSGGGGGGRGGAVGSPGGAGNTPPVNPAQGTAGGPSTPSTSPPTICAGGGGGGALVAGTAGANNCGGNGGGGATSSINGTPTARAGGGGGGAESGPGGTGGSGSGGAGAGPGPGAGTAGGANTGGGGGGIGTGVCFESGTGGSGVVIIRYKFQ